VTADAISIHADLTGYKVAIAPTVHVCTPAITARLAAFVEGGGTLILGPRSGVKDEEGTIVDALLPGPLRDLAGCTVEEYDAFSTIPGLTMRVRDPRGHLHRAHGLADILVPDGDAEPLLYYADHYYAGRPAAVRHRVGRGQCIYLGTVLDDPGLADLLGLLLGEARVAALAGLPESVEVSQRVRDEQYYTFYLNHSHAPTRVPLKRPGKDLLSGRELAGEVEIGGFGVLIIKEAHV